MFHPSLEYCNNKRQAAANNQQVLYWLQLVRTGQQGCKFHFYPLHSTGQQANSIQFRQSIQSINCKRINRMQGSEKRLVSQIACNLTGARWKKVSHRVATLVKNTLTRASRFAVPEKPN